MGRTAAAAVFIAPGPPGGWWGTHAAWRLGRGPGRQLVGLQEVLWPGRRARMWPMPKREQLHAEIDALSEDQLAAARVVVESSQNNGSDPSANNGSDPSAGRARPYLGLSDAERAAQQESMRELEEELIAEGATLGRYLPELERRAATWPE